MSAPPARGLSPRDLFAGIAGNVMEWYDFAVYGYFAAIIGAAFFPSKDPTVSLLAAFGVFAGGYLMRPLGGLIFGHIGDRLGRRRALTVSGGRPWCWARRARSACWPGRSSPWSTPASTG